MHAATLPPPHEQRFITFYEMSPWKKENSPPWARQWAFTSHAVLLKPSSYSEDVLMRRLKPLRPHVSPDSTVSLPDQHSVTVSLSSERGEEAEL